MIGTVVSLHHQFDEHLGRAMECFERARREGDARACRQAVVEETACQQLMVSHLKAAHRYKGTLAERVQAGCDALDKADTATLNPGGIDLADALKKTERALDYLVLTEIDVYGELEP